MTTPISVELLADHPHLIHPIAELRWREWGHAPEPEDLGWWVEVTASEAGRDMLPVTWVALDERGRGVGAVGLDEYDIEEIRDRSPWVIGMIVAPDLRGHGLGRQFLRTLEDWARERGHSRLWVANEGPAVGFYEACGWTVVEIVVREARPTMTVLTKRL